MLDFVLRVDFITAAFAVAYTVGPYCLFVLLYLFRANKSSELF